MPYFAILMNNGKNKGYFAHPWWSYNPKDRPLLLFEAEQDAKAAANIAEDLSSLDIPIPTVEVVLVSDDEFKELVISSLKYVICPKDYRLPDIVEIQVTCSKCRYSKIFKLDLDSRFEKQFERIVFIAKCRCGTDKCHTVKLLPVIDKFLNKVCLL